MLYKMYPMQSSVWAKKKAKEEEEEVEVKRKAKEGKKKKERITKSSKNSFALIKHWFRSKFDGTLLHDDYSLNALLLLVLVLLVVLCWNIKKIHNIDLFILLNPMRNLWERKKRAVSI